MLIAAIMGLIVALASVTALGQTASVTSIPPCEDRIDPPWPLGNKKWLVVTAPSLPVSLAYFDVTTPVESVTIRLIGDYGMFRNHKLSLFCRYGQPVQVPMIDPTQWINFSRLYLGWPSSDDRVLYSQWGLFNDEGPSITIPEPKPGRYYFKALQDDCHWTLPDFACSPQCFNYEVEVTQKPGIQKLPPFSAGAGVGWEASVEVCLDHKIPPGDDANYSGGLCLRNTELNETIEISFYAEGGSPSNPGEGYFSSLETPQGFLGEADSGDLVGGLQYVPCGHVRMVYDATTGILKTGYLREGRWHDLASYGLRGSGGSTANRNWNLDKVILERCTYSEGNVPPVSVEVFPIRYFQAPTSTPTLLSVSEGRRAQRGSGTTLSVGAVSGAPFSYQWRKDGVNLQDGGNVSGATTAVLSLAKVEPGDAGTYTAVLSNAVGVVISPPVVVEVDETPVSPLKITGVTAIATSEVPGLRGYASNTVAGVFAGTGFWLSTGVGYDFGGAKDDPAPSIEFDLGQVSTLATVNVWNSPEPAAAVKRVRIRTSTDQKAYTTLGEYKLEAAVDNLPQAVPLANTVARYVTFDILENWAGMTFPVNTGSGPRGLAAIEEVEFIRADKPQQPVITTQPTATTVDPGGVAVLKVVANGTPPLTYQWRKGGVPLADAPGIAGSQTAELTLDDVQSDDAGDYDVVVSSAAGTVTSTKAILNLSKPGNGPLVPPGMVYIPGGAFKMGDASGDGDPEERPVHEVHVSPFFMDTYEVTQALWNEVATWGGTNGYSFGSSPPSAVPAAKGAQHPMHSVSWFLGIVWCNARSEMQGRTPAYYTDEAQIKVIRSIWDYADMTSTRVKWNGGYRLPTEAEWEKAARGGSITRFPWGNTISHAEANIDMATSFFPRKFHPDYDEGEQPYTSPVGSFPPNGFGLHDMIGNLWEWCWDRAESAYPDGTVTDPHGADVGGFRIARGGSWNHDEWDARVSSRGFSTLSPGYGSKDFGFRTVLPTQASIPPEPPNTPPLVALQPSARTNLMGTSVAFTVVVSGTSPLAFAWRKDAAVLTNGGRVSGADTPTLTLTDLQLGDAGRYDVVVSNAYGTVTSDAAVLVVQASAGPDPAGTNLVQNGSFEDPKVTNGHLYLVTGDALPGGWRVESTTSHFGLYDNADSYGQGFWHPTAAGSQYVYLADNVQVTSLEQAIGTPLQTGGRYRLSFLQSGWLYERPFPAEVTVELAPTSGGAPVFTNSFVVANAAPWTRQQVEFQVPVSGQYTLRVISTQGKLAAIDDVVLVALGVPPEIVVQPREQTSAVGASATLSVTTSGTDPLIYRWRKGGAALSNDGRVSGSDTASLTITNLLLSDAGLYDVVVTNAYGSVTSHPAALVVTVPTGPDSGTNLVQNGSFEEPLPPESDLNFENDESLPGGWRVASSTLYLSLYHNTNAFAQGLWQPTPAGSNFVYLAHNTGFTDLRQALTSPLRAGNRYRLSFLQSGWLSSRSNSPPEVTVELGLTGYPTPVYARIFVLPDDAAPWTRQRTELTVPEDGAYTLRFTSTGGLLATIDDVVLSEIEASSAGAGPSILFQPQSVTNALGRSVLLSVTAAGSAPLAYQWRFGGVPLTNGLRVLGADTSTLRIVDLQPGDRGEYDVVVSNEIGVVVSAPRTLEIGAGMATGPATNLIENGSFELQTIPDQQVYYRRGDTLPGGWMVHGTTTSFGLIHEATSFHQSWQATPAGVQSTYLADNLGVTDLRQAIGAPLSAGVNYRLSFLQSGFLAGPGFVPQVTARIISSGSLDIVFSRLFLADSTSGWRRQEAMFRVPADGVYQVSFLSTLGSAGNIDDVSVSALPPGAAGLPPTILAQPASQTNAPGRAVNFSVIAIETVPLTYQWRKNGIPLENGGIVSGVNTATLTLAAIGLGEVGSYDVVVSSSYGSVTSAPALVRILEPEAPEATANLVKNGSFEVPDASAGFLYHNTAASLPGGWIVVESSTGLDLFHNQNQDVQILWHPTFAGSQAVYLADSVGYTDLRQELATPLRAATRYGLSFLQSGWFVSRPSYPAEVTVEVLPSGSTEAVFRQVFNLPDDAPWIRRRADFSVPADSSYTLRLLSTPGKVANVDDIAVFPMEAVTNLPPARLEIELASQAVKVRWTLCSMCPGDYRLEQAAAADPNAAWTLVPVNSTQRGDEYEVELPVRDSVQFYRLRQ